MSGAARHDLVVAHYHEVGLKGRNRSFFERRLVDNMRWALRDTGSASVRTIPGRILVELTRDADLDRITAALGRTFGLASFSPAVSSPADMDLIVATALALARETPFESFQVRARRGHSSFPESSQRVNEVVGQAIKDATGARVDLSHGEWTCHIELVQNRAFLYAERLPGPGGLPAGTAGRVVALLSGGIDSPVAIWELAKRGAAVTAVHFHGQPFSDPSSARQAARIAEALALNVGAEALVTGESLGQVASQTLPNMRAIDAVVETLPVLRPLVGRDKIEIEAIARRIGTYEISIDPHQDCCVLFAPRQAATRARLPELEAAEAALDVPALVEKALAGVEVRTFPPRP